MSGQTPPHQSGPDGTTHGGSLAGNGASNSPSPHEPKTPQTNPNNPSLQAEATSNNQPAKSPEAPDNRSHNILGHGPNHVRHDHGQKPFKEERDPSLTLDEDDFGPLIDNPTPEQKTEELEAMSEFHKQRADRWRNELTAYKANRKESWQKAEDTAQAYREEQKRGDPTPPILSSTPPRFLYLGTVDRLRESTVRVLLLRAEVCIALEQYQRSEQHAQKALYYARHLDYKPLSALCHCHVGIAQLHYERYKAAVRSFVDAESASGLYVLGRTMDRWVFRAREGEKRLARGGQESHEGMAPRCWGRVRRASESSREGPRGDDGRSLQDELMGREGSKSSTESWS